MVVELEHGMDPAAVANGAIALLETAMHSVGGVIVIGREGSPVAAFNTPAMPFAIAE
jgi:isoaspartyl peptidase/L-asparaginase-like protein (Ntn-hydrolase superfamily)